jgi:hypothetical protein
MISMIKLLSFFTLIFLHCNVLADKFRPSSELWYLKSSFDNGTEYILLGTTHMPGDLENLQVKDIEDIFSFFKPDAVVLEGGDWIPRSNKKEAIMCCAEMGLTAFLAKKNNAKILTWDPSSEEEKAHFKIRYPEPLLELYYFLRLLQQVNKTSAGLSIEKVLKVAFEANEKSYDFFGYPHTVDEAQELLTLLFGSNYVLKDFTDFDSKIREEPLTSLNSMRTEINNFRDATGIEKVGVYSQNYKRLLIIMGKDHFRPFMNSFVGPK